MKKNVTKVLVVGLFSVFVAATVHAADNDPGIQQRELNQQNRINQGIQSGQLTPREAGRLSKQQTRIKQREARMSARDNGRLTAKDKARLTKQQNWAAKNIYRKKHNRPTANVGR
jgi:hypothetical protein